MSDLAFAIFVLATCTGLGLPFIGLTSAGSLNVRVLAAPACGLAVLSVAAALGYRYGLAPWKCTALAGCIAVCALTWTCRDLLKNRSRYPAFLRAVSAGAIVLCVALAPQWAGGHQFSAFQGNHFDQINYLSFAAAARKFSYRDLASFDAAEKKKANFYTLVSESPDDRWTVSVVYAGFTDLLGFGTTQASYAYMAALQTICFLSVAFLLALLTFGLSWRVWLCASAATLGFPIQYVIDINAWSEMAALPVAFVAFGLFLNQIQAVSLSPSLGWQRNTRTAAAAGILFGSLFYVYPEITPIYATGIGACLAYAAVKADRNTRIGIAGSCLAGASAALLLCLPYIRGTLGFLFLQLGSAVRARPDWWTYFQKYLYYSASQVSIAADPAHHLYLQKIFEFFVALPVNFTLAGLGLYFILPNVSSPESAVWMLCDGAFLLGVLFTASVAWAGDNRPICFLVGVLVMLAVAAGTAVSGRYWVAGKALSMIQPLLFVVVLGPVLFRRRPLAMQIPGFAIVGLSLLFGLARPLEAANPSGIHYPPPYPGILEPDLKRKYLWDLSRYRDRIKSCKAIVLDVDNVVLERYVQIFLTDFDIPWSSTHVVEPNWGDGPDLGMQKPVANADCVLSSKRASDYAGATVLPLWSD